MNTETFSTGAISGLYREPDILSDPFYVRGWIGVDLDGTLAEYSGWVSPWHVGEPIPLMVNRVKKWLVSGRDVRIMTARVSRPATEATGQSVAQLEEPIKKWCVEVFGVELPVTSEKDIHMAVLYDDRCVRIESNTGRVS